MLRLTLLVVFVGILSIAFHLIGHAPTLKPFEDIGITAGQGPAGFGRGIWHGMIVFCTLWEHYDSNLYEACNNGFPYNLGFILGFIFTFAFVSAIMRYNPEEK